MQTNFRLLTILFSLNAASAAVVPSEYTLTNITGWSEAQLAALPHFDRYVPLAPSGAGTDFVPLAHNGIGLTVGNRTAGTTWVQGRGAYVLDGVPTDVSAWLRDGAWYSYSWSYTYWDGTDYHFSNGFVTHSPATDGNLLGQVVGYATMPGSGSSAGGYRDHLWLRDSVTGEHFDLTPDATRADPRAINDLGQIVGTWRNDLGYHPFIRHADGAFEDFTLATPAGYTLTPTVINNAGLVAGNAIVFTTPLRDRRPWVCENGTAVTQLPLPNQGSPDVATIADANDHGILVGEAHKADAFTETSGVRWSKPGASWQADDLNELMDDNMDFIIDRALAVNDAGHILCSGHPDGVDTLNTHKLLLTPVEFPEPAVATIPAVVVSSTSATLRAKVNASGLATTGSFEFGTDAGYGSSAALPAAGGTLPMLAEETVSGLAPATTYHFRVVASNATGISEGADVTFTTAWDWSSWAAAEGLTDPETDVNGNGAPDLIDYATGSRPGVSLTPTADGMSLVFDRSLVADGVTLTPQFSDDLSIWIDGPSYGISGSSGSNAAATEMSRVSGELGRETVTLTTSYPFARLKALMP